MMKSAGALTDKFEQNLDEKLSKINPRVLPLHAPQFNIREACKEMLLLEKHLGVKGQYCTDCIMKHMLTVEALFEEAIGLGGWKGSANDLLLDAWGMVQSDYLEGKRSQDLAQMIRILRKSLTPHVFDLRKKEARVLAADWLKLE